MRSLIQGLKMERGLSPAAAITDNTAQVSQIIDMKGHDRCLFLILLGSIADADMTSTVLLEEGDNSALTDAAAVGDDDMLSQGANAPETDAAFQFDDDNEIRAIEYLGNKRYIRLTVTPVDNGGDLFIAIGAVKRALQGPTSN